MLFDGKNYKPAPSQNGRISTTGGEGMNYAVEAFGKTHVVHPDVFAHCQSLESRIAKLEAALTQIKRIATTYPDNKAILKIACKALEGKNNG